MKITQTLKHSLFGLLALVLLTAGASAEARVHKMGTGGESGNYYSIGNDIAAFCDSALPGDTISPIISDGSTDNLSGLSDKRFSLAAVQVDVLKRQAKLNPKRVNENRIKIVSGLHTEALHLLIPKGYQPQGEDKGWLSAFSGDDTPKAIDLNSLKNQSIGSWGGSLTSAEALSYFFNLNLNVVNIPANQRNVNNIQLPLLLVGGHPYPLVAEYLKSGKWNLIPLNHAVIAQTAPFYNSENVAYTINGKAVNTLTVGVQALLVANSYRKKSRNEAMSLLATCIMGSAAELADDPDTNPLWGTIYDSIEEGDQIDWEYFPIDEDLLQTYE